MIGAGPQLSYSMVDGRTKIAAEVALDFMFWPSGERRLGWFIEPTYSHAFSKDHEQTLGLTVGFIIAIP